MVKWNKPVFEEWKNISKYSHFIAEPKMDGMRCYAVKNNGILTLVRDGGSVKTLQFPEIMNSLNIPDGTILDGEICIKRNEFNDMMRNEYEDREPIFDLALIESTFLDGKREMYQENDIIYYSLVPDYTNDGGHLNEKGRKLVAEQLLIFLSELQE